jgi:hypothetical protein
LIYSVVWNQAFRITIRHHFELQNLPFDSQSVKLSIHLNMPEQWEIFNLVCAQVQLNERVLDLSEWVVLEPSVIHPSNHGIDVMFNLNRNSRSYMLNIVLLYLVLSSLSLFVFTMDGFSDRLNFLITVVLTLVAFKFSVSIPQTGYVKLLDLLLFSHMLFCFVVMMLVTASHVLSLETSDFVYFMASAVLYVVITVMRFFFFFFFFIILTTYASIRWRGLCGASSKLDGHKENRNLE